MTVSLRERWRNARHAWRTYPEQVANPRPWIRTSEEWAAPTKLRVETFEELRAFGRRIPWRWLPRRIVVTAFSGFGVSDELGELLYQDQENWKAEHG